MNQKPKRGTDNDGMTKGGTNVNGNQAKPMDLNKGTQVWNLGPRQVINGTPGKTADLPTGTKDVGKIISGELTMSNTETDHTYHI